MAPRASQRDKRRHKRHKNALDVARPLTAREVAKRCGVDLRTVHHWVADDLIAHFRTPGRHLRFDVSAIERFLSQRTRAPITPQRQPRFDVLVVASGKVRTQLRRSLAGLISGCPDDPYTALVLAGSLQPRCVVLEAGALRDLDAEAYAKAITTGLPAATLFWFGNSTAPGAGAIQVARDGSSLRYDIERLMGSEQRSTSRRSSSPRRETSAKQSKS